MPATRGNKNAAGKRVDRGRIPINVSISNQNGLLPLLVEYLSRQGIDPTDNHVKEFVSTWFYSNLGEQLKREIEKQDATMIV